MTFRADSRKWVEVPDARPEDVFAKKKTRALARNAIANFRLKFDLTWDEMREIARAPRIDGNSQFRLTRNSLPCKSVSSSF